MVAPVRSATGARGQTLAPVSPRPGGDPVAVAAEVTARPEPVVRPVVAGGACPCCGGLLPRGRGRPGPSVDLVALVVELRGEGLSLPAVAAELDRRGIPTAQGGARWGHSSVRAILSRVGEA